MFQKRRIPVVEKQRKEEKGRKEGSTRKKDWRERNGRKKETREQRIETGGKREDPRPFILFKAWNDWVKVPEAGPRDHHCLIEFKSWLTGPSYVTIIRDLSTAAQGLSHTSHNSHPLTVSLQYILPPPTPPPTPPLSNPPPTPVPVSIYICIFAA